MATPADMRIALWKDVNIKCKHRNILFRSKLVAKIQLPETNKTNQ